VGRINIYIHHHLENGIIGLSAHNRRHDRQAHPEDRAALIRTFNPDGPVLLLGHFAHNP
jgi:hypothetical protein